MKSRDLRESFVNGGVKSLPPSAPHSTSDLLAELARIKPDHGLGAFCERREGREGDVLMFETGVARFRHAPDLKKDIYEQSLLRDIAARGIRVPQTDFISKDGRLSIQTRLSGHVLVPEDNFLPDTIRISQMTDAQVTLMAEGLAGFLAVMHEGQMAKGLNDRFNISAERSVESKMVLSRFLQAFPGHPHQDMIKRIADAPQGDADVRLHADLGYGNIFFDLDSQENPVGVLDFGSVRQGPATYDFANLASISPQVYRRTIACYNAKTGKNIGTTAPLLHCAATYAGTLLMPDAPQAAKDDAHRRLEKLAACVTAKNTETPVPRHERGGRRPGG